METLVYHTPDEHFGLVRRTHNSTHPPHILPEANRELVGIRCREFFVFRPLLGAAMAARKNGAL